MKVLVIGDIIIDKYIYGTSTRLSPEAPVPVVNQKRVDDSFGGAGLVYKNLKSLGVDVELYDYDQPKSIKTRVLCDGHYITRIDDDKHADGEAVLQDIYDTPVKVDTELLYNHAMQLWQEQMNAWQSEYNEISKNR